MMGGRGAGRHALRGDTLGRDQVVSAVRVHEGDAGAPAPGDLDGHVGAFVQPMEAVIARKTSSSAVRASTQS